MMTLPGMENTCVELVEKDDITSFSEWLEKCNDKTYEICGSNHSVYYDCYWNNSGCKDPAWHDCFWYGTGCKDTTEDGGDADFEEGYNAGYTDGYTDGVIDSVGPPPAEHDAFTLELVTAAFGDWVDE